MKITLDTQTMQMIALFEQMTGAEVKDCITDESQVVFVVNQGEIAKAIGRGGKNVRSLEQAVKKRVRVVEFHPDIILFVQNVISPLELKSAKLEGQTLFLDAKDLKTRGLLIGRGASSLRFFEAIVKRYFPITEIRIE